MKVSSQLHSGYFIGAASNTQRVINGVSPKASLHMMVKSKIPDPTRNQAPPVQQTARPFTNWAVSIYIIKYTSINIWIYLHFMTQAVKQVLTSHTLFILTKICLFQQPFGLYYRICFIILSFVILSKFFRQLCLC